MILTLGILLLVAALIAVVIVTVVKTSRGAPQSSEGASAPTVRRLIVFVLLFVLVIIGATGLAGLLGRLLEIGVELVRGDTAGLALSLAFTLVGGPFAGLLWWFVWRRAEVPAEQQSLSWGLYVAGASTVSLIVFTGYLFSALSSLVGGRWLPQSAAAALVWAAVWLWHRWMSNNERRRPRRLPTVAPVLGAAYGLIIGFGGAVNSLGLLFDHAISGVAAEGSFGQPWWQGVLGALVWAAGGALIWWWYWVRGAVRHDRGPLAHVVLAVVGVLGGSVVMLTGAGVTLYVLLRLGFDANDTPGRILDPLGYAVAAALVGALVLAYHHRVAVESSPAIAKTARLVESGVALVATASGLGVMVNSFLALALAGAPLAGSGGRALLLGGISSFVVGAPMWWRAWRPSHHAPSQEGSAARRMYLIAVFGLSAVSALITLLVLGFRLFEFTLGGQTGEALVDRVRAPLGLFVATALVAAYHFSVWRLDRSAAAEHPGPQRTITHVILVASGDAVAQKQLIESETGAAVTLWRRATPSPAPSSAPLEDAGEVASEVAAPPLEAAPSGPPLGQLADALKDVRGNRVLVVTGPGPSIEVIPLAD